MLKALVASGETLASLASRLSRPRSVIMLKCAELMLPIEALNLPDPEIS